MQAAGSRWVTTSLNWFVIEPNAPVGGIHTYDWSSFDIKVSNAHMAGMNVFVLVLGNPSWAAQYAGGPVYNIQNLVDFVTAMAERYDGDGLQDAPGSPLVNDWSFYAEPDNGDLGHALAGKGYWGNNGEGYADMLYTISPAIHSANSGARVMIGGLAYDWFTEDNGPFVRSFLNTTLQRLNNTYGGAAQYLDAVAFHYYPISARWPTIRDKALEIQSIMSQNGVGNLPLLVPEMGYWSDPAAGSSETLQAGRLIESYVRGLSVGIEHMSWFTVFDGGSLTEAYGLFRGTDLSNPKLAYTAYQTMTGELYGARYAGALTAPGAEGYRFTLANGSTKTVLWSTVAPSAQVSFAQTCLHRVDMLGSAQFVLDGDANDMDHTPNGQVVLQVLADRPAFVAPCN